MPVDRVQEHLMADQEKAGRDELRANGLRVQEGFPLLRRVRHRSLEMLALAIVRARSLHPLVKSCA
jgi:hypothetical protein